MQCQVWQILNKVKITFAECRLKKTSVKVLTLAPWVTMFQILPI
jgi:hypothetical protein